jgi:chaperone LolA
MNTIILGFLVSFVPSGLLSQGETLAIPAEATRVETKTALTRTTKKRSKTVGTTRSSRLTQVPSKTSKKMIPQQTVVVEKQEPTVPKKRSEIDRVIDGIQTFYQSAQDLRADFKQTYTYVQMGRKQRKSGRVFFKTPNRMRWDYQKPVAQVFVSDGQTLWVYQPEEAQVFKQDLRASQLPVALTFMSGKGELRSEFTPRLLTGKSDVNHHVVELIPKANEANYKAVILTVLRSDFSVVESTVIDPVGNINRLRFSKMTQNSGIPNRAFEFKVPKGVQIIDPPK